MYTDAKQWRRIRRRVLVDGVSKRQVVRETGVHWQTLQKILAHPFPRPHKRKVTLPASRSIKYPDDQEPVWRDVFALLADASIHDLRTLIAAISSVNPWKSSIKELTELRSRIKTVELGPTSDSNHYSQDYEPHQWMLRLTQNAEPIDAARKECGDIAGLALLVEKAAKGSLRERKRALAVLARARGISLRVARRFLYTSERSIAEHWNVYKTEGVEGLFCGNRISATRKVDDASIRQAVFTVLHAPPKEYGVNRTTWKMDDLKACLAEQGFQLSKDTIREIMKSAGYKWRKAKIVLTSNDPEYREKLEHIQMILSSLGAKDRFFSIDEFGPFAVKMQGGKKLVAPDDYPTVPQFQKSKGCLILTAALELSENQVTHFYSTKKNTAEMLKLLDVLLDKYKGRRTLYFSWDAASWHASKKLNERVEEVNSVSYRKENGTARVELAPLPASAQFLNVIESVFSGMAKAIIHNSDYASVDETKAAIDRYFADRNEHFRQHPKRAGRTIWGKEIVPSEFSESQNCKDPKWANRAK